MSTKTIFLHLLIIAVASGQKVTFNARNPVEGEKAKNIVMKWSINLTSQHEIYDMKAFVQNQSNKMHIGNWESGMFKVSANGRRRYNNRLIGGFSDTENMITLEITNAEYEDRGNYSVAVLFEVQKYDLKRVTNAVSVYVYGPPELCMGNTATGSQFKYTVCGVPKPTVRWGLMENDTKYPVNANGRPGIHYAHDYSLSLESQMCGKVIYFTAVGYRNETHSWNAIHKMNYLPTKVTGIKIEERKSHLTRITWNKLFVICTPKYQFRLLFKNESTPLFEYATSNSFFICDSRCAKATELDILAIVDGMEWNLTKFNLSKIDEDYDRTEAGTNLLLVVIITLLGVLLVSSIAILGIVLCKIKRKKARSKDVEESENRTHIEEQSHEDTRIHAYAEPMQPAYMPLSFTKTADSTYAELSLIQNNTEKNTIAKDPDYLEPIC